MLNASRASAELSSPYARWQNVSIASSAADFSRVRKCASTAFSIVFDFSNRSPLIPAGSTRSFTWKFPSAGSDPSENGPYAELKYPLPANSFGMLGMHTYGGRLFRGPNSCEITDPNDGYDSAGLGRYPVNILCVPR